VEAEAVAEEEEEEAAEEGAREGSEQLRLLWLLRLRFFPLKLPR
jgi:hypothetical protein